jgi:malate dehydrogenase (oxaloacetate-decarboxylating)
MASHKFNHLPRATSGPRECSLTVNKNPSSPPNPSQTPKLTNNLKGPILLKNPQFSKGSAFPVSERQTFALQGLLPPHIQTLDQQISRAYEQYSEKTTDIGKNTFMTSLKAQNETLYYAVLQKHLKEMFPIIYTPTVACSAGPRGFS